MICPSRHLPSDKYGWSVLEWNHVPVPLRTTAEAAVLIEDLARDAADLLSVGNSGQMRSLNRLAELAVREVAGCCGATAILWRDRELVGLTSTHPNLGQGGDAGLLAGRLAARRVGQGGGFFGD